MCLQRCRWQYRSIFICLAVAVSEICEIPRNSPKIQTYRVLGHPCHRSWYQSKAQVYGRFPDGYFPPDGFFPGKTFPGKSFPGWSFSPDETFPGKTSWMVGQMFNYSWPWSLTERPYCVYLNGFTVNSPHCQFAPLTNSSQVKIGRVGIYECYQVPVVSASGRHCHCVASI